MLRDRQVDTLVWRYVRISQVSALVDSEHQFQAIESMLRQALHTISGTVGKYCDEMAFWSSSIEYGISKL